MLTFMLFLTLKNILQLLLFFLYLLSFLSIIICIDQQFYFVYILHNKPKAMNKHPNQTSLPKSAYNYNSCTTRCMSVAKPSQNSNQILLKPIAPPKQLTYFLGKGNNEGLVRRVLSARVTWVEAEDSTSAFLNFKWQQDQKGMKYERLVESGLYRGLMNQFQFHEALSNKELLFRNLESYCQKQGLDVWRIVPPTYLLNAKDECNMMLLKQFTDAYEQHFPDRLKGKSGAQTEADLHQAKLKLRRIFCNSNLKKVLGRAPPIGAAFLNEEGEYLWIVKPTCLNRGRGIQVFSRLEALVRFVSENLNGYVERALRRETEEAPQRVDYVKRNSEQIQLSVLMRDPANREARERREETAFDGNQFIRVIPRGPAVIRTDRFLVQKYLERPMLIMSRKFDIRIWVLVTHNLRGFVFKEGYVRLSSLEYACTDSPSNAFMHLTNNAVQKFSDGYGSLADGNQLSFRRLREEMDKQGLSFEDTLAGIHEDIRLSLKATAKLLNANNRKFSFQIFGYDFMIDQTGFPWLIEVNNNPCIEESSKLLAMLLPRMLDDAFRLTLDPLFYGSASSVRFKVDGYPDAESMWLNLHIDK